MTSSNLKSILFLLLTTISILVSSQECDPSNKKALIKIKRFWNNPYHLASWVSSSQCCAWDGVGCDTAGKVTRLEIFADTNLFGTLPPAIGDLSNLDFLDVRKLPNLVGPIVPDLARLSKLTFLRMDWNGLTGSVPSFLSELKNLSFLNLAFNRLTGTIPASLATMSKLGTLHLDRNQLTGRIPDSFGGFTSGMSLFLSHNNLTGPVPASLGNIEFGLIDLSRNQLTGDASFLFGASKKNVQTIDLSRNSFEFDLSKIQFPIGLNFLDLNHNMIFGQIPAQITKLENLQALNVTYNRLCGPIPTGGQMRRFDSSSYIHNKCLCGTPLPPCKSSEMRRRLSLSNYNTTIGLFWE